MKRSEFKAMIREAVMECLPDIVEAITENIIADNRPIIENKTKSTLPTLTSKYKQASNHGYDDLPNSISPTIVPHTPKREIVKEQQKIVEMGGIMKWYENSGGKAPLASSEFKHTSQDVDNFLKKRFGV